MLTPHPGMATECDQALEKITSIYLKGPSRQGTASPHLKEVAFGSSLSCIAAMKDVILTGKKKSIDVFRTSAKNIFISVLTAQ